MVETRLTLEPEVQEIFKCIDGRQNFLLSGGAGSGKTHSLVQVIKQVILENPTSQIACMTYTNSAVREIDERIGHKNLKVSTIHEFLWNSIKHFQKEIKLALVTLANDSDVKGISIDKTGLVSEDFFNDLENGIQYKEYLKLAEGIISHDEVLILANYMFEKYPKISDIVKDRFDFIFIDEYQDTSKEVVDILLVHLQKSKKNNIIGFFGDAMQAIYDEGIGDLDLFIGTGSGKVQEVKKDKNRRNPEMVIKLANKLRTDGITQIASVNDSAAPNITKEGEIKMGTIKFLYSEDPDLDKVRTYLSENFKWDFSNNKETKELNLTQNLIAEKAGFKTLMEIYDKDRILELKSKVVKEIREKSIIINEGVTFGEVVDQVGLPIKKGTALDKFITDNPDLYMEARNYPYAIFKKTYANKDQLVDDKKQDEKDLNKKSSKRDNLIKHLFKIQSNISLYNNKQYNQFLRVTDFKIVSTIDKVNLQKAIQELTDVGEKTIEEVIDLANERGICLADDRLNRFKDVNKYLYNRVKSVKFREFQNLFNYLEGKTPFSTQHKTKGAEFDNVFVILDNGKWNDYNFQTLFLGDGTLTVLKRTQKIFYMCCTRSKENLAVFYHSPIPEVVLKAKEWFGEDNVVLLS